MSKKLQTIIITVSIFLLAAFVGCSMFQDAITPCYVDKDAAVYADTPLKMFTPYTSLFDAKRIAARMTYINAVGKLKYAYLKGGLDIHMAGSEHLKQTVFDPQGSIGMLLTTGLGLGLGGLLIRRPQDKKEIDDLKNGKNTA